MQYQFLPRVNQCASRKAMWLAFLALLSPLPIPSAASAHAQTQTRGPSTAAPSSQAHSQAQPACPTLLNHSFRPLLPGKPVSLCQYSGRVVLVVNTASQCGFTYQYEGLEKTWRKYRERGLTVIGFPANDFGRQEPGSNKDIAQFCESNFGVTFPMFEKIDTPIAQHPLIGALARQTAQPPQWNFHKYLIDRSGRVLSFSSNVEPAGPQLSAAIEKALAAK